MQMVHAVKLDGPWARAARPAILSGQYSGPLGRRRIDRGIITRLASDVLPRDAMRLPRASAGSHLLCPDVVLGDHKVRAVDVSLPSIRLI